MHLQVRPARVKFFALRVTPPARPVLAFGVQKRKTIHKLATKSLVADVFCFFLNLFLKCSAKFLEAFWIVLGAGTVSENPDWIVKSPKCRKFHNPTWIVALTKTRNPKWLWRTVATLKYVVLRYFFTIAVLVCGEKLVFFC